MPQQVRMPRYVSQRNSESWDDIIRDIVSKRALAKEHTYFGIATEQRADEVRRKLATAAKHQGVSGKVFYHECPGKCSDGGADCRYHVSITLYDPAAARAYKAKQHRK